MKNLTVQEIIKATNAELIIGNPKFICEKFSHDTRTIEKGDTYIAIKGETFDGNLFWKEALQKGADCIIVSDIKYNQEELEQWKNKTILKVDDTLKALYEIAKLKRSFYKIPVIAITGSVGKTSTKDIIANVVSQKYKTLKTIGNNNNNIGLPFTILKLQDEEAMVLEMGMNHFGEIRLLTNIAKPNICVITNIGTSHIGNLGSRQNILKAKLEILEGTENPTIIINNDNDLLHKWQEENKNEKNIITYGIEEKSNLNAKEIILKESGSEFTCKIQEKDEKINVPVGGEHFILNSLCAICVGKELGIEPDKIKKGIEEFELTKKRMEIIETKTGIKIINDSYNASLELGEYAEKLHKKVGEEIPKSKIDILICRGENAKYIVEEAEKLGMPKEKIYYLKSNEEIVEKIKEIAKPKDIILLKASNGMKFFDIAEKCKEEFECKK